MDRYYLCEDIELVGVCNVCSKGIITCKTCDSDLTIFHCIVCTNGVCPGCRYIDPVVRPKYDLSTFCGIECCNEFWEKVDESGEDETLTITDSDTEVFTDEDN
jgi:hypothetical protein